MADALMAPLYSLSIRLREDRLLDGSLRGSGNVRKLIEGAYEALVIPNNDGPSQAREFDYLNGTHTRIVWTVVTAAPKVNAQSSMAPQVQPVLSTSQLKKMLKQAKGSGSQNAGTGHLPAAAPAPVPLVSSQAPAVAAKKGICLHDLAQALGVQGVLCTHVPCHFSHAPLNTISKAGAIAAMEKIKTWTLSISKPELVKKVNASKTMLP
jgi:hypothetical protein